MLTGNKMIDAALEADNYTLALRLVDKKTKEQPNSSQSHAIKCFIQAKASLSNDSKITSEEALKNCLELSKKTPSDPNSINLLNKAFSYLSYKPENDLYEAAIRKYQTPNLAYEWFRYTVDNNDLIGMQKSAMSLSKGFKVDTENGRMIKLWAAATMVIVIKCCKESDRLSGGKDKLLAMLGLKLIESVEGVSKNGINAQEMYVKCELSLKKGDVESCIEELEKFLNKESDLELLLIYFDELKKNEMWDKLYDASVKYIVETCVDDYDTWKLAILASKKINKVDKIKSIIDNYKVGRNSQLAKIHVIDDDNVEEKEKAVSNYFSLYMHKLCCYLDLKNLLDSDVLSKSSILKLIEEQFEKNEMNSVITGERKATEKDLIILVNYMKFKTNVSPELFESKEYFTTCCQYFDATKHLQNKLPDFDYFAGFEFIILAIQTYLTINKDSITEQTFLNLIIVLENSLVKNKYEFHLKLWLATFYSNTNISPPLKKIYESLKIKNVQIDTLSPYFMNHLSSKTRDDELITTSMKFYTHNVPMELPAMLMSCFENCTFSKLHGFIEFKLRVENSITYFQTVCYAIQNARLKKEDLSLTSINSNYIPTLRNAYQRILDSGKDVDLKLHDNIDRKIMWECGNHKINETVKKIVSLPFSEIYNIETVEVSLLKELIVYDQNSRIWDDYRKLFLDILRNKRDQLLFSDIEKSILNIFEWLLNPNSNSENIPSFSAKPSNVISADFNNYYLTIQDFDRVISSIKKQSNANTYFGGKSQMSKLTKVQKLVKSLCREINRDEIILNGKKSFQSQKTDIQNWFKNDEFGKQFKVPEDIVNKQLKIMEQDLLKVLREI